CSSGGKTARSADSTTCAGTEGRASSALTKDRSSDPSSAHTTHGPIRLTEGPSGRPTRSRCWSSGSRITAFARAESAPGADLSGRIWTIGHPTSPKRWVSSSPGFGDSRSRISASGPARPTRSRRIGKSSGRTIPSAITAPDPPGPESDHALHVRGLHSISHTGAASPQFQRRLHGVLEGLHLDGLVRLHEATAAQGDDGGRPAPCRLLLCHPAHVLQPSPGLSHGPSTLAPKPDSHDHRMRLVLRRGRDEAARLRPQRRSGPLGSDQSPGLVRL